VGQNFPLHAGASRNSDNFIVISKHNDSPFIFIISWIPKKASGKLQ